MLLWLSMRLCHAELLNWYFYLSEERSLKVLGIDATIFAKHHFPSNLSVTTILRGSQENLWPGCFKILSPSPHVDALRNMWVHLIVTFHLALHAHARRQKSLQTLPASI